MRGLGDNVVTDMAAGKLKIYLYYYIIILFFIYIGENTTFIVTRNKSNDECEVFSCGHNING